MKYSVIIIVLLLITESCSNHVKEYPNIDTNVITSQLKWDLNYNTVKSILIDDFNLEFSKDILQKNSSGLVYEFIGGKYNNINTHSWVVAFVNDSLRMVSIKIAKEQHAENELLFKQLVEKFNTEFSKDSTGTDYENKWLVRNFDNNISDLTIGMTAEKTGIAIFFTKSNN